MLVPFQRIQKLRLRELDAVQELSAGHLHVRLTAQPFTVVVSRPDGKAIQELVFEITNNTSAFTFRTDSVVLGLGEGEQQFDRRGHLYRMVNGQVAPWLALQPRRRRSR